MRPFWAQNGPFPQEIFFLKNKKIIILICLLATFIEQN